MNKNSGVALKIYLFHFILFVKELLVQNLTFKKSKVSKKLLHVSMTKMHVL